MWLCCLGKVLYGERAIRVCGDTGDAALLGNDDDPPVAADVADPFTVAISDFLDSAHLQFRGRLKRGFSPLTGIIITSEFFSIKSRCLFFGGKY